MYIRPVHAELDVPTLHAFVRTHPLGLFTTSIKHAEHATLQTTHIPFVLDTPSTSSDAPELGILRGHIARANPQCKSLLSALNSSSALEEEVLVLFNAPVHAYVTPKSYTETKPATGKVVPTWNYAAVQVYGALRVYHAGSPDTRAFLQCQVSDLTDEREAAAGHGDAAWSVADAPKRYVEMMQQAIVGLEIKVRRIEGRFKLSQENDDGDWVGVVSRFSAMGTEEGKAMTTMVEERGRGRITAAKLTNSNEGDR